MRTARRWRFGVLIGALLALLALASTGCGQGGGATGGNGGATGGGESGSAVAADFYEGKELRVMTPNDPGGGFDFYMRTTAKYITEVAGIRTSTQNIPAAGGMIGRNELWNAEPDGLFIGLLNFPGVVFSQLVGLESVQYDFGGYEWLGRIAGVPPVVAVAADSEYESMEEMINSERPVRFAIEGKGSDAYYGIQILSHVLDFPAEILTGYGGGGEIATAVLRGEADVYFISLETVWPLVESGDFKILMLLSDEPHELLPDATLSTDVAKTEEQRALLTAFGNIYSMERLFAAPPNTPQERVEYLREVLWNVFQNEGFQQELKEAERSLNPMQGAEVAERVEQVAEQADQFVPLLEE